MTQPSPNQSAEPTIEERLLFQQHVLQVAEAVMTVVKHVQDKRLVIMGLANVLVTVGITMPELGRDDLANVVAATYDRTRATMDAVGLRPGEPIPPDMEARIKKLMDEALKAQGG